MTMPTNKLPSASQLRDYSSSPNIAHVVADNGDGTFTISPQAGTWGASHVLALNYADTVLTVLASNMIAAGQSAVVSFNKSPGKVILALYGTSGAVSASGKVQFADDPAAIGPDPDAAQWNEQEFTLAGTGGGTTRANATSAGDPPAATGGFAFTI